MDKWNRILGVSVIGGWLVLCGQLAAADAQTNAPTNAPGVQGVGALGGGAVLGEGTNGNDGTNGPKGGAAGTSSLGGAASVASVSPVPVDEMGARYSAEILRSYLRLQEQLHTALLAIQHSRAEASAEAQTNVTAMLGRLEALERELAGQRTAEAVAAQNSNRLMMLGAGGMFLIGVLAMVLTAVIQARGMNRLAEIALGLGPARGLPGLPAPGVAALPGGERLLLGDGDGSTTGPESGGGGGGGRLETTIRQLEARIRDMEIAAGPGAIKNGHGDAAGPLGPTGKDSAGGEAGHDAATGMGGTGAAGGAAPNGLAGNARAVMLAKAQALLNLGQPQEALAAMEEAIARGPDDPDLQLRRGMALERLKRFDQAIEAYDRAIALDGRCTQAYLFKGSVLNQQSRYQEALACYELALENRTRLAGPVRSA